MDVTTSGMAPWTEAASEASKACKLACETRTAEAMRNAAAMCWRVCGMIDRNRDQLSWEAWVKPAEYWEKQAKLAEAAE